MAFSATMLQKQEPICLFVALETSKLIPEIFPGSALYDAVWIKVHQG